jgi:hypothetical protein
MIARVNGEYYKVLMKDPKTGYVSLGDKVDFKYLYENEIIEIVLESLFKTKDGKDHPFPRFLDPSFVKFGFYKPAQR